MSSVPGPKITTILVVDDDPASVMTLTWLLQTRDYHCIDATSHDAALHAFRDPSIDLVITDYMIADKTGTDLAIAIKQLRNVPVILLTGYPGPIPLASSVDLFLAKPQAPEDLLAFIAALLTKWSTAEAI
jgi:DNA-binding response OmpR family regulator